MNHLTRLLLPSLAALALLSASAVAQAGWTELFPTTVPTGRSGLVGCSDGTGMLVFGGKNAVYLNELYRFDASSGNWTNMAPTGTLPSVRNNYAAAYDLARGVLVVYGGHAGGTANANINGETWEWSSSTNTWANRTPAVPVYGTNTPPQLVVSRMVYDAANSRCILFGGQGNTTTAPVETNQTWTWDGTTWTRLLPVNSPPARRSHMMAYNPDNGTTLVWGGVASTGSTVYHGDTWVFNGTDWTQIPTATVPYANMTYAAAIQCGLVYDDLRNRFVLTSGIYTGTLPTSTDTYEFDGVDWVNQGPSLGPNGRYAQATAYVQAAGKTIQFGGYSFTLGGIYLNRTFEYQPSTPSTALCFGDTAVACPCSGPGGSGIPNPGAIGNGCANSSFPAGAQLTSSGLALDNAGDTLVLTCSNIPGPGLFFQSNALAAPFINFNDGVLCAASGIIRMGVVFPTAGVASYPGGLTPAPIHTAGAPVLAPTATKYYQCWYRDIAVGFCNTLGHNMSNAVSLTWTP